MAKVHAVIGDRFDKAETHEVDGVVLAHQRVGTAKIVKGGKHIANLTVAVETSADDDDEPRLAIVLTPAEELGYDAASSLEVSGDVALKLAELVRAALPFLDPKTIAQPDDTRALPDWP